MCSSQLVILLLTHHERLYQAACKNMYSTESYFQNYLSKWQINQVLEFNERHTCWSKNDTKLGKCYNWCTLGQTEGSRTAGGGRTIRKRKQQMQRSGGTEECVEG